MSQNQETKIQDIKIDTKKSFPVSVAPEETYSMTDEEELAIDIVSVKVVGTATMSDSGGIFTVYKLQTVRSDGNTVAVSHRYSHFLALHNSLKTNLDFPSKLIFGDSNAAKFVQKRALDLERYLKNVVNDQNLRTNLAFRSFLQPTLRPDWPARYGAINLETADLPHASSTTEWWYYNSHVTTTEGKKLSAFICFFRVCKSIDSNGRKQHAHSLTWAITDVETGEYACDVLLDKDSPSMILKQMEKGIRVIKDTKIRDSILEVLRKGNIPRPDRMFKRRPKCSLTSLDIDLQDAQVMKDSNGNYVVTCRHGEDKSIGLDLTFIPQKQAIRHGSNGVVKGHDGDDMFYYFIPRCNVTGMLQIGGKTHQVSQGQGWYDHEFGGCIPEEGKNHMDYAWNWAAIQLDNNVEITAAVLINPKDNSLMETRTVLIDPESQRHAYANMSMEPVGEPWTSCRTFRTYPTKWLLKIPEANIELRIDACAGCEDQEFMTLIAKPAFWEGRCDVYGTINGQHVTGLAYVERNGFDEMPQLSDFFKAVGKTVRKSVKDMYPDHPTEEQVIDIVANKDTAYYCKGVPSDILQNTLMAPVRLIADRGGKSWRSYGALACCDVVGGDSRNFVKWLAMPEFMHVGSLIVDDIQDASEERRGGPCAHLKYGEALCINSGTAAYFMCEHLIKAPGLSAETLNKVYQLYFACLRGGHAGQALDIYGLDYLMPKAIEEGTSELLEERSLAIHMLKTAVPAGTLARMGALVGGGTEEQVEAVGKYFEAVGLAFQIMDDVLNLRGLYFGKQDEGKGTVATAESNKNKNNKKGGLKPKTLKVVGEDIMCGKVTMPVAKAMSLIKSRDVRAKMWATIASKPQDKETVDAIIAQLEECGALDACKKQADDLVEEGWRALDAKVPDSFSKMMLRSFGWFVVRR